MKDNIVFAMYKDESIGSTNNFRSKVKNLLRI